MLLRVNLTSFLVSFLTLCLWKKVNTAARMESNGLPGRIHISSETQELLVKAGKQSWIVKREELIDAKGKGLLQTAWLDFSAGGNQSPCGSSVSDNSVLEIDLALDTFQDNIDLDPKLMRLVDWNADILAGLLKQIVAHRRNAKHQRATLMSPAQHPSKALLETKVLTPMVIEEVAEIIELPEYASGRKVDLSKIELDAVVLKEILDYVKTICSMYHDNPFHNFEHVRLVFLDSLMSLGVASVT